MNNPGFDENNRLVNKLPLPDAVEGAKPVDYHTYVLLHNELIEAQKRTEVIAGKLLIVYDRLQKSENQITEMQEINKHNVKVINGHSNSISTISNAIRHIWRYL